LDWKQYEREIEAYFRSEYPSAYITTNAKRLGKFSKVERQIDLLIEQQVCDLPFRIVIDAKFRGRKIDVKDVEEFLGMVGDVCAHKAIMISSEGYTDTAIQRASADDADLILDVLNFSELQRYQGFGAFPFAGQHAVALAAPLGWVVDATQGRGALAWLYQQGLTLDEATKAGEFMYVNFWNKEERGNDLESLCKFQESYLRKNPCVLSIALMEGVPRKDAKTAVRSVIYDARTRAGLPDETEYTGFVDFDGFIFMCVLFTRNDLSEKNLSKLRFVLRKVLPIRVKYKNTDSKVE
jgi:hypothetical protein